MKFITGLLVLVAVVLGCLGIYGWIHNIYNLLTYTYEVQIVALRIAGIFFAPLGMVLGYI